MSGTNGKIVHFYHATFDPFLQVKLIPWREYDEHHCEGSEGHDHEGGLVHLHYDGEKVTVTR